MSETGRLLMVARLLAVLRELECVCAEMTCERCIAHFIKDGQFEEADAALSRWEQVSTGGQPPRPSDY